MKKKKTAKIIVLMVAILLIILIIMGVTDYRRTTHSFEKPVFAQVVNGADDGGSGLYVGIGYSVDINGNFMPEDEFKGVTQAHFYVLGREVCYAIID